MTNVDEVVKLSDIKAFVISEMLVDKGISNGKISAPEIKILMTLKHEPEDIERVVENTKIGRDIAEFVLNSMLGKGLVIQGSWKLSEQGVEVKEKCLELLPNVAKLIGSDPFAKELDLAT